MWRILELLGLFVVLVAVVVVLVVYVVVVGFGIVFGVVVQNDDHLVVHEDWRKSCWSERRSCACSCGGGGTPISPHLADVGGVVGIVATFFENDDLACADPSHLVDQPQNVVKGGTPRGFEGGFCWRCNTSNPYGSSNCRKS